MERARELIKPYLDKEGVIGIYLVGSMTRPHSDPFSDYDIEVIVEDEVYARTPDDERQIFAFKEGEPRVVDYEYYLIPWSDFEALTRSRLDLFHYPYQHAVILHDPDGRIETVVKQLAELPEDVRQERMRVRYLEFMYRLGRARKTMHRGDTPLNTSLLCGDAVGILVDLLFLAKRSWPSTRHWSEQELNLLDVPEGILESAAKLGRGELDVEGMRGLIDQVRAFLDDCGETFHQDIAPVERWLFFHQEGKAAFERWGNG